MRLLFVIDGRTAGDFGVTYVPSCAWGSEAAGFVRTGVKFHSSFNLMDMDTGFYDWAVAKFASRNGQMSDFALEASSPYLPS